MRLLLALFAAAVIGLTSASARAIEDPSCPNAAFWSGILTDICWGCVFPVRVAGISIGSGRVPPRASSSTTCLCQDEGQPIPRIGIAMGYWEPARLIEVVRSPNCLASLGGVTIGGLADRRMRGHQENDSATLRNQGYYHVHTYAFPLLYILDVFLQDECMNDGYFDVDVMFMTELDPTWTYSAISAFQTPEAFAVANPVGMAACAIDATAAAIRQPMDEIWWCAGSWGMLTPFVGWVSGYHGGMPEHTSLLAARSVAASHRRGLSWRTMGSDVMCGAKIDPLFPKSQYKASMFWPRPEANDAHVIGESTVRWGTGRTLPGAGHDAVYLLFRWNDCCLRLN